MDNPDNRWLHSGGPGRMVLNPPDKRPAKVIYSPKLAELEFDQMVKEVSYEQKSYEPKSTLEVPWLIKLIATVGVVGALALGIKTGISKIFKKKPPKS